MLAYLHINPLLLPSLHACSSSSLIHSLLSYIIFLYSSSLSPSFVPPPSIYQTLRPSIIPFLLQYFPPTSTTISNTHLNHTTPTTTPTHSFPHALISTSPTHFTTIIPLLPPPPLPRTLTNSLPPPHPQSLHHALISTAHTQLTILL